MDGLAGMAGGQAAFAAIGTGINRLGSFYGFVTGIECSDIRAMRWFGEEWAGGNMHLMVAIALGSGGDVIH